MNLYVRLFLLSIGLIARKLSRLFRGTPAPTPLSDFRLSLHVWPNDLDLNLHMNNGRYLTVMDLGRLHFMAEMGLVHPILRNRWYPVVGSVAMVFKRSMKPFQKYTLVTRIAGWDEKWFYIEQRFERHGVVNAVGVVKGLFKKGRQLVSPQHLVALVSPGTVSPELPEWAETLKDTEGHLYESTSAQSLTRTKALGRSLPTP